MFSLLLQTKHKLWIYFSLLGICFITSPVLAKPNSLKEVTDANWEEILTGEWMIELSVSC